MNLYASVVTGDSDRQDSHLVGKVAPVCSHTNPTMLKLRVPLVIKLLS